MKNKETIKIILSVRRRTDIPHNNGMVIASCAEAIDLKQCGIEHNTCIDKTLLEDIVGYTIHAQKENEIIKKRTVKFF